MIIILLFSRVALLLYIIMQKNDKKALMLKSVALKYENVDIYPVPGSAVWIPYAIIKQIYKRKKTPSALVYRYLNDYPSLIKTIIRLFAEVIGVIICLVLKVNIVWICHNVDRESSMNYPGITCLRRKLLVNFAKVILVTDPGLMPYAKQYLNCNKIDYITLGPARHNNSTLHFKEVLNGIKKFIDYHKSIVGKDKELLIGFCSGTINWKTAQFELIPILLRESALSNYHICLIVIGPLKEYYHDKNPDLLSYLQQEDKVFIYDKYLEVDEGIIASSIDFYWRSYSDLSVPLSLYNAVDLKKPMLVYGSGYLQEIIKKHSLGAVINKDFSNLEKALKLVESWDSSFGDKYLESHNWVVAAKRLVRACGL